MSWDNTAPSALTVSASAHDNTAPTDMAVTSTSWNNVPPAPLVANGQAAAQLYLSEFAASADGWTAEGAGAAVAGNIDAIGSLDDCLRLTLGAAGGAILADGLGFTAAGQVTRIQFRYFIPAANTTFGNGASDIYVLLGGTGTARTVVENAAEGAAWGWAEIEITAGAADNSDELRIGVDATVTAGDLLYLRDIRVWSIT